MKKRDGDGAGAATVSEETIKMATTIVSVLRSAGVSVYAEIFCKRVMMGAVKDDLRMYLFSIERRAA